MHKTYIDKLAFIYLENKKILETLSFGKDTWYIPGGKREGSETDIEALIREVKEELDVDLLTETIRHYGTFEAQAHGKPEGTMVRMTCFMAEFEGDVKPTSEVEKLDYFSYADKHRTSPVDHLVFDDLKSKGLIE
jgi:8-oxo-dGTP diphosphatase